MQLANASSSRAASALRMPPVIAQPRGGSTAPAGKPESCGWFDSSFDLATGLEVIEQDNDTLFQLWRFSQR